MKLNVKRLSSTAKLPTKAYESDAGWDVYADEDVEIRPGETVKISTGIAVQLDEGLDHGWETPVNLVWDRGSVGSKGVHRLAGVADYLYNSHLFICLTNLNTLPLIETLALYAGSPECFARYQDTLEETTYIIKRGDKIAQVLTQKVSKVTITEVNELRDTDRGANCLGSSDAKVQSKV